MLNEFNIEILDDIPFPSQSSTTSFQVNIPLDPTPGTFEADISNNHFNMRWVSLDEFEARCESSRRKIPSKHIACPCAMVIKTYFHTNIVLGSYQATRNHAIEYENLCFTCISPESHELIAGDVQNGVSTDDIIKKLHANAYSEFNDSLQQPVSCDSFITVHNVHQIKRAINVETITLASDDGQSVCAWAADLAAKDSLLGFKAVFNMILTTLAVHDKWGHGIPVAWMIASSGTEPTITYFLCLVKQHSPSHPELWDLLKSWICITNYAKFQTVWAEANFSMVNGIGASTSLLTVLCKRYLPYYHLKQARQEAGFEGKSLEVKKQKQVIATAFNEYCIEDIQVVNDPADLDYQNGLPSSSTPVIYLVRSKSDSTKQYQVDLELYLCSSLDFTLIHFCKHLCVVQYFFGHSDNINAGDLIPCMLPLAPPALPTPLPTPPVHPVALPICEAVPIPLPFSNQALVETAPLALPTPPVHLIALPTCETVPIPLLFIAQCARLPAPKAVLPKTVLPNKQKVAPNWSTAKETAAIMPHMKNKKRPVYDSGGYSGGKNSGSKANSKSKPRMQVSTHASTSMLPVPSAASTLPVQSAPTLPTFSFTYLHQNPYTVSYQSQTYNSYMTTFYSKP
ncbi:hypothetical protein BT96DRAFT_943960 [Gymnopus androsaceus JB14]|uniref:Uncharacterized protein n=1 Tax=Gymnopus androsaceus JB14 TaxID=1447944 RepID=A0A6A4H887_9AGAR|nr:hypothetical protein BT96DRAFT_943960 [Gymnopus androsaceus JB14]